MQWVNLGQTGLKVSRLCLGTMTYGSKKWRPWVLDGDASRPFFRQGPEPGELRAGKPTSIAPKTAKKSTKPAPKASKKKKSSES